MKDMNDAPVTLNKPGIELLMRLNGGRLPASRGALLRAVGIRIREEACPHCDK